MEKISPKRTKDTEKSWRKSEYSITLKKSPKYRWFFWLNFHILLRYIYLLHNTVNFTHQTLLTRDGAIQIHIYVRKLAQTIQTVFPKRKNKKNTKAGMLVKLTEVQEIHTLSMWRSDRNTQNSPFRLQFLWIMPTYEVGIFLLFSWEYTNTLNHLFSFFEWNPVPCILCSFEDFYDFSDIIFTNIKRYIITRMSKAWMRRILLSNFFSKYESKFYFKIRIRDIWKRNFFEILWNCFLIFSDNRSMKIPSTKKCKQKTNNQPKKWMIWNKRNRRNLKKKRIWNHKKENDEVLSRIGKKIENPNFTGKSTALRKQGYTEKRRGASSQSSD